MKKLLFVFSFFLFLIFPVFQSHPVYIKQNTSVGLSVSTDTTALDDWQSQKFVGLFLLEDVFIIPEYEYKFPYDFREITNRGEYWESVIAYNVNQKYKINLKLLKLKVLKWYKGQPPESDYIYSISQSVTEGLQSGDQVIISFYKFSDNFNHGIVMGYDIKDFKEYTGSPFVYYYINNFIPVFKVLEDEKHQLYVSGCVDGFTNEPLKNFPLIKFEDHLLQHINKEPQIELIGMYPVEITTRKVKKCRKIPISEKAWDSVFWAFGKVFGLFF